MITPISPVAIDTTAQIGVARLAAPPAVHQSFADMLVGGVRAVEGKVASAEAATRAFVLDDSIPVHQVTYALEQAQLSLEMMMQVRGRLVEAYQQLMGMQL